ncbi:hypothetical protein P4H71_28240 [Paenibacillus kribbensis]|uniref:hypothetical protein n=1 Tax=Paenibacillus kribbensis TaxID=172713 RepID=UPI002DB65A6A|nr:hypothetical protein [Paenibacillus kribbensis]MEC0238208.1 hypothetical protein [Paenibacillus kribbensis]
MKNLFEKINWKVMNLSAWIVIIVAYVYPFRFVDNVTKVGFPISFLTVYGKEWRTNLLMSFDIDLGRLIINIAIVYLVITVLVRIYKRYKKS